MSDKYFVQVGAPSKQAFAKLQEYGFDLFRHTARRTPKKEFKIDGLLTAEQSERLVKDGYTVLMQQESSLSALGASEVIELPEWLAERGF
jgi:hypothetical protein